MNFIAVPLEPATFGYSEYSRHYIHLQWSPPMDDGGSSILYYTLQQLLEDEWVDIIDINATRYLLCFYWLLLFCCF